jgi:hypothetical protein
MVAQNEVVLKHISTSHMIADPLTKPIAIDDFSGSTVACISYYMYLFD